MTHTPYGYQIEKGKIILNEEEAENIKVLYQKYLELKSMRAAAKSASILKAHSYIGKILKNKIYLGDEIYQKIIDEDIFYKVQELRDKNARDQNRLRTKETKNDENLNLNFKAIKVKRKYKDPYKQAEYSYSLIKEVED